MLIQLSEWVHLDPITGTRVQILTDTENSSYWKIQVNGLTVHRVWVGQTSNKDQRAMALTLRDETVKKLNDEIEREKNPLSGLIK